MNHFQKFNKAKRNFFLQKMLDFSSVYFGVKDWRKSNMIWDALYKRTILHKNRILFKTYSEQPIARCMFNF